MVITFANTNVFACSIKRTESSNKDLFEQADYVVLSLITGYRLKELEKMNREELKKDPDYSGVSLRMPETTNYHLLNYKKYKGNDKELGMPYTDGCSKRMDVGHIYYLLLEKRNDGNRVMGQFKQGTKKFKAFTRFLETNAVNQSKQ